MRVLEEQFMFRPMQQDRYGAWKPSAVMAVMQETAGTHSAHLGLSREQMIEQHHAVWVLTRNELEIFHHPQVGDMVTATTWPGPSRRGLYPRYHHFLAADGTLLARAVGGWTLADIHTRRMVDLPAVAAHMPDTADIERYTSYPRPVQLVAEGEHRAAQRPVLFSDIDQNQHVNNTRCADWVCDLLAADDLGGDLLKRRRIAALATNYRQEILPGGPVTLSLMAADDRFSMTAERDGERLLEVGGTLALLEK